MRKYRLFGVLNPFDILISLAIIALIWGMHLFSLPQQAVADGGRLIRFTIEMPDRPEGFYQTIEVGAEVLDGVTGLRIGHVLYAYPLPFRDDVPDEGGNIVRRAVVPGREFTYIVVEAWANITDYATEIGQFHVRVNQPIFPRSRNFAGTGIVTGLEFQ